MSQTLTEIQIICIDDGSVDDSAVIIERMSKADSRVSLIRQQNSGVSAARNIGISYATGEYLGFVDADDWIEPNMYKQLLDAFNSNEIDWSVCNIKINQNNIEDSVRLVLEDKEIDIRHDKTFFLNDFFDFKYDYANWNKLYRRNIIIKHELLFQEGMKVWEDLLFNLSYAQFVNKVSLINQPLYNYRIHSDSTMGKSDFMLIEQYNLLFCNYRKFCHEYDLQREFNDFNRKMADGVYNNLFPKFSGQIKSKETFFKKMKLKKEMLSKFNHDIYKFDMVDLSFLQRFKRSLLMNRKYGFFAFMDNLRYLIVR